MSFWNSFKTIWMSFKLFFGRADQIARAEREIRWAKARLSIKNASLFEGFEDWIQSLIYQQVDLGVATSEIRPEESAKFFHAAGELWKMWQTIVEEKDEGIKIAEENLELEKSK